MKKLLICLIIFFFSYCSYASEITIIELHNKSIDQLLDDNRKSAEKANEIILLSEDSLAQNKELIINNQELLTELDGLVTELNDSWESIDNDELLFLFNNISSIKSNSLKLELISFLNTDVKISSEINKNEFDKLILDTLLKLGERKKAYEIVKLLNVSQDNPNKNFYNELIINHLLSTYNLSEACSFKSQLNDSTSTDSLNFFLKLDIFCLALEEKFDEANLLNSLLIESNEEDAYFQTLFEKLQNVDLETDIVNENINLKNIFLYSAMHRIGNLPLNSKFLDIDPINLSMPIILSSSSMIDLRIKSAHFAFFNQMIGEDSLAALYQTVDFSYNELNNPSDYKKFIKNNIEIGMSYFYQLINIQLLPATRLEAIMKFWDFAENYNLENIAYTLSIKNLNTIEPSNNLAIYGPRVAKAYILENNFEKANKWLLFSENKLDDDVLISQLDSSKLLLDLLNLDNEKDLKDILINNFENISKNFDQDDIVENNEILFLIFSSLGENQIENFNIDKKISEDKKMPPLYLLNLIRNSVTNQNYIQLLLAILVSVDGRKWNELHPEHFRIILESIKEYRQGSIYDSILLEVLKDINII